MKKLRLYSMLLLASLSLTACKGAGTSASYDSVYMETIGAMNTGLMMDGAMAEDSYRSSEAKGISEKEVEMDMEENPVNSTERKLIKNVSMEVETTKFDEAIRIINNSVTSFGGYVESSGVSGHAILSNSERYANIRARIPQE